MKRTIIILFILQLPIWSCQKNNSDETNYGKSNSLRQPEIIFQNLNSNNCCKVLSGKVYTFLPPSNESLHLFTLKFDCVDDTLRGLFIGPSPEGEHGLFFYKAELKKLIISDSSDISFSIVPGELYERQITLENYGQEFESSGRIRFEFLYSGKFLADTVVLLNCFSEYENCFIRDQMRFTIKN